MVAMADRRLLTLGRMRLRHWRNAGSFCSVTSLASKVSHPPLPCDSTPCHSWDLFPPMHRFSRVGVRICPRNRLLLAIDHPSAFDLLPYDTLRHPAEAVADQN